MSSNENPRKRKILITGVAGFIGFHLAKKLIEQEYSVIGIDNVNDYYDVQLKYDRLKELGISQGQAEVYQQFVKSNLSDNFTFQRINLEDKENLDLLFRKYQFDTVCNLAAQAGVRYSIQNPDVYINSNIVGFLNLLECCRHHEIEHLVYASSSSVYGDSSKVPFSTEDNVDHPVSLYAATKKSNELMAYTYSHLFNFKTTGLRFFTVYGPWGRPDMAMFLFTDAIMNKKPIKIFNHGNLERDFTFIDDIIDGVIKVIDQKEGINEEKYSLYNIGNNQPVKLLDFVKEIEKQLGMVAIKEWLPMQPGDVSKTWADVGPLEEKLAYKPETPISKGINEFIFWYKKYYNIKGGEATASSS